MNCAIDPTRCHHRQKFADTIACPSQDTLVAYYNLRQMRYPCCKEPPDQYDCGTTQIVWDDGGPGAPVWSCVTDRWKPALGYCWSKCRKK